MKPANVPLLGTRYWVALALSSVLGTNTGDFTAHELGLGHALGLVPLAALFAAILIAERRARSGSEAFYWAAILTLRTGATNIADLADHDLRVAPLLVIALLALGLTALVASDRTLSIKLDGPAIPATDTRYWTSMLLAGVFGTALGDYVADNLAFTPGPAALVTLPITAVFLVLRDRSPWKSKAAYWVCVAAARTAGTNVGDWLAAKDGLALGLPIATAISASTFCAVLLLWPERPPDAGGQLEIASAK